jgi:hypothetical protein
MVAVANNSHGESDHVGMLNWVELLHLELGCARVSSSLVCCGGRDHCLVSEHLRYNTSAAMGWDRGVRWDVVALGIFGHAGSRSVVCCLMLHILVLFRSERAPLDLIDAWIASALICRRGRNH